MEEMTPKQIMETAVKALDDRKGGDIRALKTTDLTVVADYFVLCTASSATHIKTLSDEVEKRLEESGEAKLRREGYRAGGWVLLDYGAVIVHIFLREMREFYNLERLWNDAVEVDLSSLTGPC